MSYLCNTDEDDEDGGRAAVGSFQVFAAGVFWKHPFGDKQMELLITSDLFFAVGLVLCEPEPPPISVHGERLLLLDVVVLHHCPPNLQHSMVNTLSQGWATK